MYVVGVKICPTEKGKQMEQKTGRVRLTKDEIIQELINLLNQHQQKETAAYVFEIVSYVDGMEKRLDTAVEELINIRKQLEEMKEKQDRKAIRDALANAVGRLEQHCQVMKQQLFEVKEEVKSKATEMAAEIKQRGKMALNGVAEFLGIKEKLQGICRNVQESIVEVDKSIQKIDAFGTGMREAGRKIANAFRVLADKPEKEYGEKKFSKTELIKRGFQTKRKLLTGILDHADAAIERMERLAEEVKQYQREDPDREIICAEGEDIIDPAAFVAEPECRYGAEVFESYQQAAENMAAESMEEKVIPVRDGKHR